MATFSGSSSSNPTRMVTFTTIDRKEVKVPVRIAMEFDTVRNFCDGDPDELVDAIPFPVSPVTQHVLLLACNLVSEILELHSKHEALEKEVQDVKAKFLGQHTDETIVELVKAANYLGIEKLLDFMIPSVWKRFGIEDDKDADFVYMDEFETILQRRAESGSGGGG